MNKKYNFTNANIINIDQDISFKNLPSIEKKIAIANKYQLGGQQYEFHITSDIFDPSIFTYIALKLVTAPLAISSTNNISKVLKSNYESVGIDKPSGRIGGYTSSGREYHIYKLELKSAEEDADHYVNEIVVNYFEDFIERNNVPGNLEAENKTLEYINNVGELISNAFLHSRIKVAYIVLSPYENEFSFGVYDAGVTIPENARKYFKTFKETTLRDRVAYFRWSMENENTTKKLWNKKEEGGNGLFRVKKYANEFNETFYLFSGGVLYSANKNKILEIPKDIDNLKTTFAFITLRLEKENNEN